MEKPRREGESLGKAKNWQKLQKFSWGEACVLTDKIVGANKKRKKLKLEQKFLTS